jgi:hypothetical protein
VVYPGLVGGYEAYDLANQITSHRAKIVTATARDKIVQEPTNPDTFFPPLVAEGPAVVVAAADEADPVMVAEGMTVYEVTTTLGSEEDGDSVVLATAVRALGKAVNDVTVIGGKVTLKLAQSFTNTNPSSMNHQHDDISKDYSQSIKAWPATNVFSSETKPPT